MSLTLPIRELEVLDRFIDVKCLINHKGKRMSRIFLCYNVIRDFIGHVAKPCVDESDMLDSSSSIDKFSNSCVADAAKKLDSVGEVDNHDR